jgi:tripartite-type tricarboxylate transporter receptor subunit TctC
VELTMNVPVRRWAIAVAMALATLAAWPAAAWTAKPVRFVVPGPPGGTSDVAARIVGEALSPQIGQPVIVDNKPGGGGAIAIGAVLAAAPDGQTLLVGAQNVLTEVPLVLKVSFDPIRDVKPVAAFARVNLVLVANLRLPAGSLQELVVYAKANPGKLSYASYSPGTASHYAGLILNQKAGIDLQHVPYKGSPPALTDLVAGQLPLMFDGMPTALPFVRAGKLKALAVTGASRSTFLPGVPTFAELGYSDIEFTNWIGAMASAKLSPELTAKIHAELAKALQTSKVRSRLTDAGLEPAPPSTPAELERSVRADYERNARIVKAFQIKFE